MTRPTADLGEDGELIRLLQSHSIYCTARDGRFKTIADRLILYREALGEARSWIGSAEENYCSDDVLRMIDEALSRSGG